MFVNIGKLMNRKSAAGRNAPQLSYSPVIIILGDSFAAGTLSTAELASAASGYAPNSRIKVLGSADTTTVTWNDYKPGTANGAGICTGISFGSTTYTCGQELGLIQQFFAQYPNDTLHLIKEAAGGSYQSRGIPTGGTPNITCPGGNGYTVNSGSVAGNNTLIVGSGIETGCYIPFIPYLAKVGIAGGRSGPAFGPVAVTQYNATLSWSSTEGLAYNGNSANITNGARARIAAGLAQLANPRIVAVQYNLGTNDMANAAAGAAFATDLDNFIARASSDFNLANAVWNLVRCGTGGTASTTVRSAINAKAAGNPAKFKLIDTDSFTRWDGTHLNLAGNIAVGNAGFANIAF